MIPLNNVRAALISTLREATRDTLYLQCLKELPPLGKVGAIEEWLYALGGDSRRPQGFIDHAKELVLKACPDVPEARARLELYDLAVGLRSELIALHAGAEPVKASCRDCDGGEPCAECDGAGVTFEEEVAA